MRATWLPRPREIGGPPTRSRIAWESNLRTELHSARWRAVLLLIDALAVLDGIIIARAIRYSDQVPGLSSRPGGLPDSTVALLTLVWLAALVGSRSQDPSHLIAGHEMYRRIFFADSIALVALIGYTYFNQAAYLSRGFLLFTWVLVLALVSGARWAIRQGIYHRSDCGQHLHRVLVVGANRHGVAIAAKLQRAPSASAKVLGFLDDYDAVGREVLPGLCVLGEPMGLFEIATATGATHALVVESGISWESHQWLIRNRSQGGPVQMLMAPGLYDFGTTKMELGQLGPVLLIKPNSAGITGPEATLKRILDVLAAAVLLVITAPLQALIAWRLRPATLSARQVVGRGGREFSMLGFQARPWMRQFHMARLPSLVHVLTGTMSLVGPRPIPIEESKRYADWSPLLEAVRPGFVGPWWLVGSRRPANLDEEIMLDLQYLRNYTIWFDLHVLAQAIRLLFTPTAWELPAASELGAEMQSARGAHG